MTTTAAHLPPQGLSTLPVVTGLPLQTPTASEVLGGIINRSTPLSNQQQLVVIAQCFMGIKQEHDQFKNCVEQDFQRLQGRIENLQADVADLQGKIFLVDHLLFKVSYAQKRLDALVLQTQASERLALGLTHEVVLISTTTLAIQRLQLIQEKAKLQLAILHQTREMENLIVDVKLDNEFQGNRFHTLREHFEAHEAAQRAANERFENQRLAAEQNAIQRMNEDIAAIRVELKSQISSADTAGKLYATAAAAAAVVAGVIIFNSTVVSSFGHINPHYFDFSVSNTYLNLTAFNYGIELYRDATLLSCVALTPAGKFAWATLDKFTNKAFLERVQKNFEKNIDEGKEPNLALRLARQDEQSVGDGHKTKLALPLASATQ